MKSTKEFVDMCTEIHFAVKDILDKHLERTPYKNNKMNTQINITPQEASAILRLAKTVNEMQLSDKHNVVINFIKDKIRKAALSGQDLITIPIERKPWHDHLSCIEDYGVSFDELVDIVSVLKKEGWNIFHFIDNVQIHIM